MSPENPTTHPILAGSNLEPAANGDAVLDTVHYTPNTAQSHFGHCDTHRYVLAYNRN